MRKFLSELVTFLATQGLIPPEVTEADMDREKTYLFELPSTPDNITMCTIYRTENASMVAKETCVHYVQIIIRNRRQDVALEQITSLYMFLLQRPDIIENITPDRWVIFDVQRGPVNLGRDEQNRSRWALSFPVKTQIIMKGE